MRTTLALALFASSTALAVPMQLTHQGRLLDNTGLPVTGQHDLTVALYANDVTTTSLWSETQSLDFDGGYFAFVIGQDEFANPLDGDALDIAEVWVGVTLDNGTEGPRQRIFSVPFSLHADGATNVTGGVVDASEIRIGGTTVIDGSGSFTGTVSGDTLGNLTCLANQVAIFDGTNWGCGSAGTGIVAWGDLVNVPSGFVDNVDDTLSEAEVDTFVSDNGYALASSLADVATSGSWNDLDDIPGDLSDGDDTLTELEVDAFVANNGYALSSSLASVATSGDYGDLNNLPTLSIVATSGSYTDLSNTPTLHAVATSGDYGDLVNTPTLASVATSGLFSDLASIPSGLSDGDDDTQLDQAGVIALTDAEDKYIVNTGDIVSGDLAVTGLLGLGGNGSEPCTAAEEGMMRYNSTLKVMEFCNATVWGAVGGTGLKSWQIFTSDGTWTRPPGITRIEVIVTGGGGGGGSHNTDDAQGGGGAGGTAISIIDVSSISSVAVTIGAGGTGGCGNSSNAGSNGGTSSFGTLLSATGGEKPRTWAVAGYGGIGQNGDLNLRGNDGVAGNIDGGGNEESSGTGGASYWGGAGGGGSVWGARNGTSLYGSGGAGTHASTNNCGGNGGDGIIVVREFGS